MAFYSCKDNKKEEVKVDKNFKVAFNAIVTKDDNFQIYYNEDGSIAFEADKYIDVAVKGKNEPQEIVFDLPEDVIPQAFRFDIGSNKEQKGVKFLNFKMKYFDKEFQAKDTLFIYYFGNNEQIDYDRKNAIATPKIIEGQLYDPIFMSKSSLKDEINKMIK